MNIWKIAPGPNAYFWEDCRDGGFVSINWLNKTDVTTINNKQALTTLLIKKDQGKSSSANSIWYFVYGIRPGDIVVANNGRSKVEGIGIVTSRYLPPNSKRNPNRRNAYHKQVRLVDWKITESIEFDHYVFAPPTVLPIDHEQRDQIIDAYLKQHPKLKSKINKLFKSDRSIPDEAASSNDDIPMDVDSRTFAMRLIAQRRGRQRFRDRLFARFGERCLVTGCELLDVLEAAHVYPYRGDHTDRPDNGLILRTDIHTLFDLHLLGIHPTTLEVELNPKLLEHEQYKSFHGRKLGCSTKHAPSKKFLQSRYKLFQDAIKAN